MYAKIGQKKTSAVRQAKSFAVVAAVIAAWLTLFGGLISSINGPVPLPKAIEKVLSTPTPAQPARTLVAAVRR
jgi:hypothetical protein